MDYKNLNDYELLSYVSESEESKQIIFEKYKPRIDELATKFIVYCHNTGIELNDLTQEGMVGLNDAIINFSETRDTTFYTFAIKCIKSKMISAIVKAKRLKNKPLNTSIYLELNELDKSNSFGKTLVDNSNNPEKILINKEEEEKIIKIINNDLSEFEKDVINLKINGFKYREIADILGKEIKLIDNTVQKIKRIIREKIKEN